MLEGEAGTFLEVGAEDAEAVVGEIQDVAVVADRQAANAGQLRVGHDQLELVVVDRVDLLAHAIGRIDLAVLAYRDAGQAARALVGRQQVLAKQLAGRQLELEDAGLVEVFLAETLEIQRRGRVDVEQVALGIDSHRVDAPEAAAVSRGDELLELAVLVGQIDLALADAADEELAALGIPGDRFEQGVALGQFEGDLALTERLEVGLEVVDHIGPGLGAADLVEARIVAQVDAITLLLHLQQQVVGLGLVTEIGVGQGQGHAQVARIGVQLAEAGQGPGQALLVADALVTGHHAMQDSRRCDGIDLRLGEGPGISLALHVRCRRVGQNHRRSQQQCEATQQSLDIHRYNLGC